MATLKAPFALDESFNTTEGTPRNIADVLAEGLSHITGRTASEVEYDNTDSGLTSDDVQGAIDELSERPTLPSVDIQTAVDEFETYNGGILSSLKVSLTPNQDLHGYDSPWVGGAGKNKLITPDLATLKSLNTSGTWSDNKYTYNGVTYTVITDNDGNVTGINANGTATGGLSDFFFTTNVRKTLDNYGLVVGNSYIFTSGLVSDVSGVIMMLNGVASNIEASASGRTFTVNSTDMYSINIRVYNNNTANNVLFKPMIRLSTETDASFEPYTNICPISGHTQVDVDVSDGETTQEQVTVNLGGTYYSGTLDVVSGVFTPDTAKTIIDENSAIYNWNSPQSPWCGFVHLISNQATGRKLVKTNYTTSIDGNYSSWNAYSVNRDVYVCMNENIIGGRTIADMTAYLTTHPLEVVYELATPTPIQLSPTMVKALVGENHLSAPLDGQEITESKYKKMFTFDDVIAYIQSLS